MFHAPSKIETRALVPFQVGLHFGFAEPTFVLLDANHQLFGDDFLQLHQELVLRHSHGGSGLSVAIS